MEAAPCVKQMILAANQYRNSRSNSNLVYLQRQLEILHGSIGKTLPLKFFSPSQLLSTECITCMVDILNDGQSKSGLVLKCLLVVNHIAQEFTMKEMFQKIFNLTPVLANVLKTYGGSPSDQLTSECLQLLLKITHGHRISFHESFMEDLVKYLIKQAISPFSEITQSCLGLMANFCRDNYTIQSYIKGLESYKKLIRTLCTYMSDKNLTVAVFSLCSLTSLCLHEEIGQVIFHTENVNQTLQLIFNILVNGDSGITRLYVVNLFQDLLKNPSIQLSLQKYTHLPMCINHTLKLISTSPPQTVAKLFELLLCFSTQGTMRTSICKIMFSAPSPPNSSHYSEILKAPVSAQSEPLFATIHWAMQACETSDMAPLYALDLLTEVYEEVLYSDRNPSLSLHSQLLLPVLVNMLQNNSGLTRWKCQKIVKAIKLLTVLCSDDDLKANFVEMVDGSVFQSVLDYQLNNNKILLPKHVLMQEQDDWGQLGVEVALVLMQLMSKLQRYITGLDVYLNGLLQDSRVIQFLACGLVSDSRELVHVALQLVCKGSALDNFPDVILGDAVATLNAKKSEEQSTHKSEQLEGNVAQMRQSPRSFKRDREQNKENIPVKKAIKKSADIEEIDISLQSIIEKLHSSLDVKDTKASDIIEIYEHKFQTLQTKEEHLEDLLEAKNLAVAQADQLIAQYRARQARYDGEAQKLCSFLQEAERKAEQYTEQIFTLNLEREKLQDEYDQQQQDVQRLELKAEECEELRGALSELQEKHESTERTLCGLQQEHKTMSDMHDMLQKHHESLKQQHDVTTDHLRKLEDERKQISKLLKEKEAKLQETSKTLHKTEEKLQTVTKEKASIEDEKDKMERTVDQLRTDIQRGEQQRRELNHKVVSLEDVVQEQEKAIKEKEDQLAFQQRDIDKHQEVAALIHSLSGGKKPA